MNFHTIITHEYPDLDALLCCYLLTTYGEKKYPGIKQAQFLFFPAGQLEKTPEELEQEGILAVDIGGGRLDTHPVGNSITQDKLELSAANLVAEDLEIQNNIGLKNLLEFTRLQDSCGQSISSKSPIDHAMALPNMIKGALLVFKQNFSEMVKSFFPIFQAIERSEEYKNIAFCTEELPFVIGITQDKVCFPKIHNLKSIFSLYLANRYLNKEIVQDIPDQVIWYDFLALLEQYNISNIEEIQKVISFLQNLLEKRYFLDTVDEKDTVASLVNIINGLYLIGNNDFFPTLNTIFLLLDSIIAYEKSWNQGIEEYNNKKEIHIIHSKKIVAIEAKNGTVLKVARWQDHPDIIVYHDLQYGNYSITLNKTGKLSKFSLSNLAYKIRIYESIYQKIIIEDINNLSKIGELYGWFLHQSQKMLLHGSLKSMREPSHIPFDVLIQLVISELDRTKKLPLCTDEKCMNCPLFSYRFSNCFEHRRHNRNSTVK